MGAIPAVLMQHSCTVEPYLGTTGTGVESFAAAITIDACFIDTGAKSLTRGNTSGATGDELGNSANIYVQLSVDTSSMTVRSRVRWDLGNGPQEARVDSVTRYDGGGLPVPSHALIRVS